MARLAQLVAGLVIVLQGGTPERPRDVVRVAEAAVAGDSLAAVAARWTARWQRDSSDRAALFGLATLARLTYAYARAESLYARLVLPRGVLPDGFSVYARLGQAKAAHIHGLHELTDSLTTLALQAARAARDTSGQVEALIGAALTASRRRGPGAADSLFRQAARLMPAGGLSLQATFRCARAMVLVLAHSPEARVEAARGAQLARQIGDRWLLGACQMARAGDLVRQGQADSALAAYGDVIREARHARDRGLLAVALQWRGYVLRSVGALAEARRDLIEAVAEARVAGQGSAEAWALSNLASVSLLVGDLHAGASYASQSAARFAAQHDGYGAAVSRELEGSVAVALGNVAEATTAFHDALARYEASHFAIGVYTTHVSLAYLAIAARDWPGARHELDQARRVAVARGMSGATVDLPYHFGVLALREGNLLRAERLLHAAARGLRQVEPNVASLAEARLAEVAARRGELDGAVARLDHALTTFEAWRATLTDQQLRTLAFQYSVYESDPDFRVAHVIAALAAHGHVQSAFQLAERIRARELLDELVRAEVVSDSTGPPARDVARTLPVAPSPSDVRSAIPDDSTALLEFVTGREDEPTTAFVVTRDEVTGSVLAPQDSFAAGVTRLATLLESGADPAALATRLGTMLLAAPLARLSPQVGRLVIVADGVLHRLPFDALILPDGRHVVERYAVSLVPSAAIAVRLWRRPHRTDPVELLAVANPALPASPVGRRPSGGSEETGRMAFRARVDQEDLPRLPAAGREVRAVARYAPAATILEGEAASEAWFKHHLLTPYRIIHFATHALVDDVAFGNTALVLASGGGENGFLGPGDLARLRLAADLVVLSACRTAHGPVVRGEGVQGLAAPLLDAGARAVAVTYWPISDRGAVRRAEAFYRALASGLSVTEGLRSAKLADLRHGAPPREWAAFTLVGDPLVRIPLRQPPSEHPLWIVVVAAVTVLAVGFGLLRWNRAAGALFRRAAATGGEPARIRSAR